jgi:cyclophilin family peptidyl-prolyl cis-trans isomerase
MQRVYFLLTSFVAFSLMSGGCESQRESSRTETDSASLKKVDEKAATKPAALEQGAADDRVVITTTHGKIVIDLFEDDTPGHAKNFKKLAGEGFYNGVTFHRVIPGFMAQGGDPDGTGRGGPGYTQPAEIKRKHVRGSVAAARQGDRANPERKSSGSQFYICFKDTPFLDDAYTVFGQVVEGMDVVDKLKVGTGGNGAMVPSGSGDQMQSVEVVPAK